MDQLSWVWPVPVLVLAAWLILRVRRDVQGGRGGCSTRSSASSPCSPSAAPSETVIEATDGGRSANGGELVDVGGHKLFITCSGTGSPTVVLEGGLGQGSDYFALIAPRSHRRRGCAPTTGPAGAGASPRPAPRTDGHRPRPPCAPRGSGNPGPYILAGHSAGGVYVRFFAAAYPARLPGSCCSTPCRRTRRPPARPPRTRSAPSRGRCRASHASASPDCSLGRVERPAAGRRCAPARPRVHPARASSFGDEFLRLDGILDAAGALPDLGDRPLVVVTAMAEAIDGWLDQQDRLATLSTNVSHRVFPDLTHDWLIETVTAPRRRATPSSRSSNPSDQG